MPPRKRDADTGEPVVTKRRPKQVAEAPTQTSLADATASATPIDNGAADATAPEIAHESFHDGGPSALRTAEVLNTKGAWVKSLFMDLGAGDTFRLFEPDGTPAADGLVWLATSDPYRVNAEEDKQAIDAMTPTEAKTGPIEVGDTVYLRTGSPAFEVTGISPFRFDAAGKESDTGEHRRLFVKATDGGTREYGEEALSRVPVSPVIGAAPEEDDPVELALAQARAAIPDDVVNAIRGLWAGERQIEAIMLYRRTVAPEPNLAEAKLAVEYIVGEGEAPEDFDVEGYLAAGKAEPEEHRAEVVQLFAQEPPKPRKRPALRVAPKPPPRTGKELIGRRTTEVAFDLSDTELLEHGQTLAHLHMAVATEEAIQAGAKKAMREKLAGLKAEIARESAVVNDRREVRNVVVYMEADFTDGIVRDVILEGDVIVRVVSERPITPDERQLPLFRPEEQAKMEPEGEAANDPDGMEADAGEDGEEHEDDVDDLPPMLNVTDPDAPLMD